MPSYLADLMVRGISKRKLRRKRRARKLAIYRRLKIGFTSSLVHTDANVVNGSLAYGTFAVGEVTTCRMIRTPKPAAYCAWLPVVNGTLAFSLM